MTLPQYLRQIRMERAAELLRTGQCNVTEAALEVGYSSLSHFSSTFQGTFGCCPGLYPVQTATQQAVTEPQARLPTATRGKPRLPPSEIRAGVLPESTLHDPRKLCIPVP